MPRTCFCHSISKKDRAKLDAAILAGEPLRAIANRVGVSHAAIYRHKQHVPTQAIAKHAAQVDQRGQSLAQVFGDLKSRVERLANDAFAEKDRRGELGAIREMSRLIDLGLRAASELKKADSATAPMHTHTDWPAFAAVLSSTLAK